MQISVFSRRGSVIDFNQNNAIPIKYLLSKTKIAEEIYRLILHATMTALRYEVKQIFENSLAEF